MKQRQMNEEFRKITIAVAMGKKDYVLRNIEMACLSYRDRSDYKELAIKRVGDIIIYFAVTTKEDDGGDMVEMEKVALKKNALEKLGLDVDELVAAVKGRTNVRIYSADEYSRELADKAGIELTEEEENIMTATMLVVRTTGSDFGGVGATAILYDDWKESVAKRLDAKRFYIIPASVNELICVPEPKDDGESIGHAVYLTHLLHEQNSASDSKEVLSYKLYLYDSEAKSTMVCVL